MSEYTPKQRPDNQDGVVIQAEGLTKHYGSTMAVDDLSFEIQPGRVTGFLGPNGAGKSTTLRMILGLDTPSGGRALVDGRPYRTLDQPLRLVGSLLDAGALQGGRSARNHLEILAAANRLPGSRVGQVLDQTGLANVAGQRVKGFSLGMRQRLGIAAALLGDPAALIFDEPVNGLDPEGIRWIRDLMKSLAAQGRTVFVSSHLMSEMALTADHLIVIGRGRLIADTPMSRFLEAGALDEVLVRASDPARFRELLRRAGGSVTAQENGFLLVTGLPAETVSRVAASHEVAVYELSPQRASLEDVYLKLTAGAVDYSANGREL